MTAMRYVFLEKPKTAEDVAHLLGNEIIPIFKEYWDNCGEKFHGRPFGFDEQGSLSFMRAWVSGAVLMVMAYEDDKPVGFIVMAKLLPLLYQSSILHIDSYYGRSPEILRGLFNFLKSVLGVLSPDEVLVPELPELELDMIDDVAQKQTSRKFIRFER